MRKGLMRMEEEESNEQWNGGEEENANGGGGSAPKGDYSKHISLVRPARQSDAPSRRWMPLSLCPQAFDIGVLQVGIRYYRSAVSLHGRRLVTPVLAPSRGRACAVGQGASIRRVVVSISRPYISPFDCTWARQVKGFNNASLDRV